VREEIAAAKPVGSANRPAVTLAHNSEQSWVSIDRGIGGLSEPRGSQREPRRANSLLHDDQQVRRALPCVLVHIHHFYNAGTSRALNQQIHFAAADWAVPQHLPFQRELDDKPHSLKHCVLLTFSAWSSPL
jgi:hypothetical protein